MPQRSKDEPAATDDTARPANRVNALMHGLSILQMFGEDGRVVTVSEMARVIGVHRSNASRLAATLHAMGFLTKAAGDGRYALGPQLIRLGRLAGQDTDVAQRALGPLRELVAETGETGHIALLDGLEAYTVAVVDGWHTVRMHGQVNRRAPAHCSSLGKALLAGLGNAEIRRRLQGRRLPSLTANSITSVAGLLRELDETRARGYAVDNEELELGLRCVAAPVHGADGAVVASLGLSGPAARVTATGCHELGVRVRAAARQASVAVGADVVARD